MIATPADPPVVYPPYRPSDLALVAGETTFVRNVIVYNIPELPTYADARAHLDKPAFRYAACDLPTVRSDADHGYADHAH